MLEAALAKLVQRCSTSKGKVSCPLIDSLMDGGERTHDS
jgi:MerR family mercuric resistance operon transcriptional regulator